MNLGLFGENLQKLRASCGLSLVEAGDIVGVSTRMIEKWEEGKSLPDGSFVALLAKAYGVSECDVLMCEAGEISQIMKEYFLPTDYQVERIYLDRKVKLFFLLIIASISLFNFVILRAVEISTRQIYEDIGTLMSFIFLVCIVLAVYSVPMQKFYDPATNTFSKRTGGILNIPFLCISHRNVAVIVMGGFICSAVVGMFFPMVYLFFALIAPIFWRIYSIVIILFLIAGILSTMFLIGRKYE